MKQMIIDGIRCEFDNARNVLEVARHNHIDIPSLCYCENLSVFGGCRLCVVETERGAIEAACTLVPRDGMVIRTNTARLRRQRQMILELLLSKHKAECTVCDKSGSCKLQEYAHRFGVSKVRFSNKYSSQPVDDSTSCLVRDPSKCILCGNCVRMCSEVQNIHAVDFIDRGSETYIGCGLGKKLSSTKCVGCGQCASVCPTGALTVKNDISAMWKMLHDSGRKVAVQIDPAVCAGIGGEFGINADISVFGKIVTALKRMGADYVFNSALAADLACTELSSEFSEKLKSGAKLPLYTSLCPSWIKHVENKYPELLPQVSTCGSAMEIFGALIRQQYADDELYSVAVTPCTAKKAEAKRPELVKDGENLIDLVITAQELVRMIKEAGIDFSLLSDTLPDSPFGSYSGSGVISAVSGGVTEALLRSLNNSAGLDALAQIAECGVRGPDGTKTFEITAGGSVLKFAVVSGLGNADKLIEKIKNGEEFFHFVEVMACPGGCVAGGGQPQVCYSRVPIRSSGILSADEECMIKVPEENPAVKYAYRLLGSRARDLLHVNYSK